MYNKVFGVCVTSYLMLQEQLQMRQTPQLQSRTVTEKSRQMMTIKVRHDLLVCCRSSLDTPSCLPLSPCSCDTNCDVFSQRTKRHSRYWTSWSGTISSTTRIKWRFCRKIPALLCTLSNPSRSYDCKCNFVVPYSLPVCTTVFFEALVIICLLAVPVICTYCSFNCILIIHAGVWAPAEMKCVCKTTKSWVTSQRCQINETLSFPVYAANLSYFRACTAWVSTGHRKSRRLPYLWCWLNRECPAHCMQMLWADTTQLEQKPNILTPCLL